MLAEVSIASVVHSDALPKSLDADTSRLNQLSTMANMHPLGIFDLD